MNEITVYIIFKTRVGSIKSYQVGKLIGGVEVRPRDLHV